MTVVVPELRESAESVGNLSLRVPWVGDEIPRRVLRAFCRVAMLSGFFEIGERRKSMCGFPA